MSTETLDGYISGMIAAKTDKLSSRQAEEVRDIVSQELRKNRKGMAERMLTTRQAAEILNVSDKTITKFVRDGKIKSLRMGKKILISHETIENLIKKNSC